MSSPSDTHSTRAGTTVNVSALFDALEDRLSATFEHELTQLRSATIDLARRVDLLSEQIAAIERNVSTDVLDALVQVTQHLEAVQTASSWALLQELAGAPEEPEADGA